MGQTRSRIPGGPAAPCLRYDAYVFLLSSRHPIFVAREKKKKNKIFEKKERKNWIKRDFPPRARYHLLKALKNPPLRKISLVQRGYNSSQSILQQFVKIHVRYSSSKQFLFFLISTNLISRSTPLFREISLHRIVSCIPFPMMISFRFCYEGVVFVV